jgi:hypothetical protein
MSFSRSYISVSARWLWAGVFFGFIQGSAEDNWVLDAGYWMLASGYWLLVTGYWLLDNKETV